VKLSLNSVAPLLACKQRRFAGCPKRCFCEAAARGSSSLSPLPSPLASRGFTLIEAMVVISLAAVAGSALLLGLTSSLRATDDSMRQTIAYGMARQLMDEAIGCRYMEPGSDAYSTTLGPETSDVSGVTRILFNDIDDFNGFRSRPPTDAYGVALGTDNGQGGQRDSAFRCSSSYLANWRQEIDVYYVSDTNLTTAATAATDYRVVEVRIIYVDAVNGNRTLAKLRQVATYVAPLGIN
jgi:prepilin-type N-terminal cleavage/methylation domain-containing protein